MTIAVRKMIGEGYSRRKSHYILFTDMHAYDRIEEYPFFFSTMPVL